MGIHRIRRKVKDGVRSHFYAWLGGPVSWTSAEREPTDPAFFVAFSQKVQRSCAAEYMTHQIRRFDCKIHAGRRPRGCTGLAWR